MECTVPVEVHLATDHADIGSLERTVSAALAEVGVALWRELAVRLEASLPVPVECTACSAPVKANGRAPRHPVATVIDASGVRILPCRAGGSFGTGGVATHYGRQCERGQGAIDLAYGSTLGIVSFHACSTAASSSRLMSPGTSDAVPSSKYTSERRNTAAANSNSGSKIAVR
jgi:hypothetical protein